MSKPSRQTWVALLRGINVTGNNMIPMARLRVLCEEIGWADVRTYIQSGNIVFTSTATSKEKLETRLGEAIEDRFGLTPAVIVRSRVAWPRYVESNPFPGPSKKAPSHVLMGVSKSKPNPGAEMELRSRAANGERVRLVGDALWVHYAGGVAGSKLSSSVVDRAVGSPVTMRNWNTVRKITALALGL